MTNFATLRPDPIRRAMARAELRRRGLLVAPAPSMFVRFIKANGEPLPAFAFRDDNSGTVHGRADDEGEEQFQARLAALGQQSPGGRTLFVQTSPLLDRSPP